MLTPRFSGLYCLSGQLSKLNQAGFHNELVVSWVMKLNPQQAPLYGDCVVTVLLAEEDKVEDDVVFYLVFSGSTLHHCTSTRKVSSNTLETIAPGHDCCETVKVLLCASKEGLPVFVVAQEDFQFIQDEAYDAAQFLATSAGNQQALNFTRFLDRSGPPSTDVNSLDEKVALAFRHLKLPAEWNVLGTDTTSHDGGPRETLMHFAVRLGLLRLTWFLLQKPGGRGALSIHNQEGATPVSLALERGYHKLHRLLTEEDAGEPDSWSSLSYEIPYGDCSVRHHRELDVYMLTSESEPHQEPPLPGDSCTGHIFKLMNIQQQLMKTNLKQMDSLTPSAVTAQDPSGAPHDQDADGHFLPCASEPTASLQLASPGAAESCQRCRGSTVGQTEGSCDLPGVATEEDTDPSCRTRSTGVARTGCEVGPAPATDPGAASAPDSCVQSLPDGRGEGPEGLPSCGVRDDETTFLAGATDLASPGSVLQGGVAQVCSGGKLVVASPAGASAPEAAGEGEHGLMHPDAAIRGNMLEVEESMKKRFEDSSISTAGASDGKAADEPVDGASLPDSVLAASPLDANKPAESILAISNGKAVIDQTAETETSKSCEESAHTPGAQNLQLVPAAAGDEVSEGLQPNTPLASVCAPGSPSDLTLPGPHKDMTPNPKSEVESSGGHSQNSESPICSAAGGDKLCTAPECQPSRGTSSGVSPAEHRDDTAPQAESTTPGRLGTRPLPTARCPSGPQASSTQITPDTPERVEASLQVSDKESQGEALKVETSSADPAEVVPHPQAAPPKAEKEGASGPAVTPGGTLSLAGSPGSESVTKDDALSLVPSQSEKGRAALQPHTDGGDGPDGDARRPEEQPPEGGAAALGPPPAALDSPPGMGNAGPGGLAGEQERPSLSAAPEAPAVEGTTASALLPGGQAAATEGGKTQVVPEGPGGEGKARTCPATGDGPLCSGASRGECRPPPPAPEAPGVPEEPGAVACAEDRAPQPGSSPGTPLARLHAKTKPNKEVAPAASRPTGGGATQSLVPPGAGLAADSSQDAPGAEPSSSAPAPDLLAGGPKAPNCSPASSVPDVEVENTPSPGKSAGCEVSGDAVLDGARVHGLQEALGAGTKDISHNAPDTLSCQEENMILGLPGASPATGVTNPQGTAPPELVAPPGGEKKLEGADCGSIGPQEAQGDSKTHHDPLQPVGGERPPEMGPSGEARGAPALPCTVSTKALHRPEGADSIEEAASRIVDSVIEQVKASGALMTGGALGHRSPPRPPEAGPGTEPTARASAGETSALQPAETPPVGSGGGEASGSLEQCFAGSEEPEMVLPVQGPAPETEMPDTKAEDEVDFLSNTRESSVSEEAALGNRTSTPEVKQGPKTQAINRENWCTIEPCPDAASLLAPTQSPECDSFLDIGLGRECASKPGVLKRESGSDSDLFHSPGEDVDSIVFSKPEEEQLACDVTGSSSSTDDTASLDQHSSHGSDVSLPQVSSLNRSRDPQCLNGFYSHGLGAEGRESESEPAGSGEMEEEEMDSITEVPASCSVLRSSMRSLSPFRRHSWGPGKNAASDAEMNHRSFSLEGLTGGAGIGNKPSSSLEGNSSNTKELRHPFSGQERGDSLVSLSEEDLESGQREHGMFNQQTCHRSKQQGFNYCTSAISSPLTKSFSLTTISHSGLDTQQQRRPARRISLSVSVSPLLLKSKTLFSLGSSYSSDEEEELHSSRPFHSTSSNLTGSITEENFNFLPQSPKKDFEIKSGTKVSRTFSYIKNKMSSSKKSKEKEKEKDKIKEKEKDSKEKEKDKKTVNGHAFSSISVVGPFGCHQCMKSFTSKDAYTCANCGAFVHKGCRESLSSCAKVKMKQPKGNLQAHDTSSLPTVIMRSKSSQPKERPRSAVLLADETIAAPVFANRRSQQSAMLSKSVSIQNIAGVGNDENISNTWKFLSHSTDSLNKISKVNESTESLTDEGVGTDMNEGQLMGDFETESKQLEAESWSQIVDSKFLKQHKKDVVKRQEVIYELMQTEFHHLRTLKIMSDVYSRGMMADLLFEQQMVEKLFPCLDELISIHSQFFQRILERKKDSLVDKSEKNFLIKRIGDVLVHQFSGENAERLKKTYGKFCGQHNQSVNYFKDLHTKDKRFQAFVKKKMSSSVVRRLGIPECILLVTQRITKYPVLFQRILQCTKDNEVEQQDLTQSLGLVKEVISAVDSKVASYEKKVRLNEIYTKTDSKSIMRMKSGQMFAKEDLRRKKLVRDGSVFLKSATGRLKEVQAVLLTDILVFLQEKDQKYVFASLDQKSTVISLKKLIVREVAHEEKGLFLISMGMKDPEMVEVHASSKEERNSWIQIIQDTINTLNRDEDEGIPSENEEEKKMLDTKARELKEQLQQKDQQILLLLEEKEMIFRDMTECSTPLPEDCSPTHSCRTLFRSSTEEALKGGPLMKSAINEVEILQGLVSGSLRGSLGQVVSSPSEQEGVVGPVSLPRRAETFGGFDSHQMNASKGGEKEEGDDGQDLRRTESDSGLKKGGNANLVFMLKRNSEQVIQSVVHLHELLSTLQGVVLQQDSYIEDQKLLLSERALTRTASRPSSLIEQEKQRSLEKQRQDLANLQRQQAQHQEERRRREREWEARERALAEREARLAQREDELRRGRQDLERERDELLQRKGAYQGDLERLRAAQRLLEREQEQLRRDSERLSQVSYQNTKLLRIPSFSPNPEETPSPPAPSITKSGSLDSELSVSPKRNSMSRTHKEKGPFHMLGSASQTNRAPEAQSQTPVSTSTSTRLFGLAKPKEKKEKKKKGKGSRSQPGDGPASEVPAEGEEIFC
ncbi:A-kinase anchor protein 13 isoform X8 [Cervus canadensis]|uniref:A-kinase anchor protein 13 isoform X8 n=1 Tax=Cervus canadensis TaxID=1574408 RepID=UPI001C9E8C52|nr:A-kinase anchor protein 13 isoform X8 [Cervus canadensis]